MKKNIIKIFLFSLIIGCFFVVPVQARPTLDDAVPVLNQVVDPSGIRSTANLQDLPTALGFWAKVGFSIVGLLFFLFMFLGGFRWLMARGEEEKIKKAQNTIIAATIGLVIIVASYAITSFVEERVVRRVGSGDPSSGPGDLTEGPPGCCVDWTSGREINSGPLRACRITTEADCKFQGEQASATDNLFCDGPAEGCWMWYEDEVKYVEPENAQANLNCRNDYCR